ncbi:MAG: toluene hydroxylase [Conexibacter sp.]|nr:toluene hydroxylase [Conexibacter sp.]
MDLDLNSRESRQTERSFDWYDPKRKRGSLYEDVTIDVVASTKRHLRFGYQVAFPDGRPQYWDATAVKSTSFWEFTDPRELWSRNFYEAGAVADREISSALSVADANALHESFSPAWVEFLRDNLQAIALAEYGLVMPWAHAMRPAEGDGVANCISFQGGFKLRHAQALALYGMHLDEVLGDFPTERGKHNFLENGAWQPTRRYLERLETVHDWVEIIVASNIVFEPLLGVALRRELLMHGASANGDVLTPVYGRTGEAEWDWAKAWATGFVAHLLEDQEHAEHNREVIGGWLSEWMPMADEALEAVGGIFAALPSVPFERVRERVEHDRSVLLAQLGLEALDREAVAR